ncbi:MAG TPA: glycosyl transferase, partial [Methanocella sp.]|nr:glycosyl transferase [Methanocella sp.]
TKLVTGEDVDLCNRIKSLGKFVYNPDAVVYVSTRRVREWGYLKMLSFYTSNTLRYYTLGTVGKSYEPIR